MKKYSLKPTNENVIEMLKSDSLGRNGLLFKFIELLGKLDDECWTVAVNGDWGSGKTFFVKQAKIILDVLNPQSNLQDNICNDIKKINYMQILEERQTSEDVEGFSQNTSVLNNFATVYYDAWLNDNHDDPILSLMYSTIASNQSTFNEEKRRNFWNIIAAFAGAVTKRNLTSVIQEMQGKDICQELKDADYVSKKVKEFIDSFIGESNKRLVIFIDELDRCKPDYAIRFLERIKHYFDDARVIFVFSVNLLQLQYTVKNYYGTDFDATRYLDKFFDLRFPLPTIEIEQFMRIRLHFRMDTPFEFICIETAKHFTFTLRECEHYVRLVKIAYNSSVADWRLTSEKIFALTYILPILIALQIKDMKVYTDFMSGTTPKIMVDILLDVALQDMKDIFLKDLNTNTDSIQSSAIEAELTKVYNAIFTSSNNDKKQNIVGMVFSNETRKYLENALSLLSNISNYNN